MGCPFVGMEEHERRAPDEDADEVYARPVSASPVVPAGSSLPMAEVGVREPRRVRPVGGRLTAAGVPGAWQIPLPPYIGKPIPVERPVGAGPKRTVRPFATREDFGVGAAAIGGESGAALETMEAGLAGVPEAWRPSEEDLAFLEREVNLSVPRETTGIAREDQSRAIAHQVVEEAAARSFEQDSPGWPWWLALPAVRALLEGKPPAQKVPSLRESPKSTFRTGQGPYDFDATRSKAPRVGQGTRVPYRPTSRGGFGGLHVNAAEWTRGLIGRGRKSVNQNIAGKQFRGGL